MAELVDAIGLGPIDRKVLVVRVPSSALKIIMISAIQKLENGTIQLTISIPYVDVKKEWESVIDEVVKNAEISGFRKGKAPRNLVEEKADHEKVREEALKKLLPKFYLEAIKEHKINPIISPKVHVEKLEDPVGESGKDWQFVALTCETPVIKLGNYKDEIRKVTAKSKIVIPGKEPVAPKFEDIVKALLESINITIPEILVESETDRLLSQTLDEVKRLGMTLDQYLSSTGRNPETLRVEYRKKAENDTKLEFALRQIAEDEKIIVEEKEIDEAIQKAKDETERKHLTANRYLLASILRQQKTLDFLKNL